MIAKGSSTNLDHYQTLGLVTAAHREAYFKIGSGMDIVDNIVPMPKFFRHINKESNFFMFSVCNILRNDLVFGNNNLLRAGKDEEIEQHFLCRPKHSRDGDLPNTADLPRDPNEEYW